MKYKFLFNCLKNSIDFSIYRFIDSADTIVEDNIQDIYEDLIHTKVELENKIGRKLPIVDKFLDGLFLERVINSKMDINKVYKKLSLFMKSCSINDFRELYLYKLTMYNKLCDKEGMLNVSLPFMPYMLLTVICGGILYRPLELSDNIVVIIGNDLDNIIVDDKFFNNPITKDELTKVHHEGKVTTFKNVKPSMVNTFKVKLLNTLINKPSFFLFEYLERLLSLYNSLHISSVNKLLGKYVDIDMFKLILGNNIFESGDYCFEDSKVKASYPSFVPSYNLDCLRSRDYILPSNGVILKIMIGNNDISAYIIEDFDDVVGAFICQMSSINGCKRIDMIFLTASVSNIFVPTVCTMSMLNLYNVKPVDRHGNFTIELVDLYKFISDIMIRATSENPNEYELGYRTTNYKFKEFVYDVYEPSYWKYKGLLKPNSKSEVGEKSSSLLAEKKIKINAFKRKLPSGSVRSKQAEDLAKKYCIDLQDDETIVSSFERKQKVKLNHLSF